MINSQQYSTQRSNNPNGQYAFDLKLNVDFNSGHLSVNVPPAPFSRKCYGPTPSYIQNSVAYSTVPQYLPMSNHEAMQPNYINSNANVQAIPVNNQQSPSESTHAPQLKYVESLNTTSFRAQQPPVGVQCVICQKLIREQTFSLDLQQHRNRKKIKTLRNSIQESDVSIRNKNEEAEMVDIMNQQPHSYSFIPNSLNFSQSNNFYSNPRIASQQSNTVIFPLAQESAPIAYQSPVRRSNSNSRSSNHPFQVNSQTSSFNFSHTSLNQPQQRPSNHISYSSSQSGSFHSNPIMQYQPVAMNGIHINQRPPERDHNILQFHRIESMIIRPEAGSKPERGLEDCGQSIISRNSQPTKYSQIYAIERELQVRKPAFYNQESSSSDEESIKVYPSKSYRSGQDFFKPQLIQRSNYTEKLSKTKLPVNYLARQEFITTSTQFSNTRKSRGMI